MSPETDVSVSAPSVLDAATDLLQRVAQGDQRAFSELYDLITPRMLGLVRHVLKDHAQSEEVVQEVLLEIWQTAPRFDPNKGKAVTWMLTMAHRRAIDRVRSAQSSRDRDTKIGIRDLGREYDSVAENVEIRIEHERVEKALTKLTELQRQAVELAYYGGYTHSEVSTMLSVPIGSFGTPEDIAASVSFLLSSRARAITGQVLYVCGGKSVYAYPDWPE